MEKVSFEFGSPESGGVEEIWSVKVMHNERCVVVMMTKW